MSKRNQVKAKGASNTMLWIMLGSACLVYGFYYLFNGPIDYSICELCDGHRYLKVYDFYKFGQGFQVRHPYFLRPLVPYLASILPFSQAKIAFDAVNFLFFVLSVFTILRLWQYLNIRWVYQWVGLAWLILHWSGIIRYNLYDYYTVDVGLYFFHAIALLLFFKKKYAWFYWVTPLAMLQKESFLSLCIILTVIHIYFNWGKQPFKSSVHIILSTALAMLVQYLAVKTLPEQLDSKSALGAILWHGRWALQDPTRFIRWGSAIGSAFGILPLFVLIKFNWLKVKNLQYSTLLIFSLMYFAFGLLAGEDMVRIVFLGFPFIMTLVLQEMSQYNWRLIIVGLVLSFAAIHIFPIDLNQITAVDRAPLAFVYKWAAYYIGAVVVFLITCYWFSRSNSSIVEKQ